MAGSIALTDLPDSIASASSPHFVSNKREYGGRLSGGRCSCSTAYPASTKFSTHCCPPTPECDSRRDSEISTEQEFIDIHDGVAAGVAANKPKPASDTPDKTISVMCRGKDDYGDSLARVSKSSSLRLRDAETEMIRQRPSTQRGQKLRAASHMVPACPCSLLSVSRRATRGNFQSPQLHGNQQAPEEKDRGARPQHDLQQPAPSTQQYQCLRPIQKKISQTQEQLLQRTRRHFHLRNSEPCVHPGDSNSRAKGGLVTGTMPFNGGAGDTFGPVALATTRHAEVQMSTRAMSGERTKRTERRSESDCRASTREAGVVGVASRPVAKSTGKNSRPHARTKGDRSSNAHCADAAALACLFPEGVMQTSRAGTQSPHSLPADLTSGQVPLTADRDFNFFSPHYLSTSSSSFMSSSSLVPQHARQGPHLRPLQPRPTVCPRTCDGRSPLRQTAAVSQSTPSDAHPLLRQATAGSDRCGSSLCVSTASASSFFSFVKSCKDLARSAGKDPKDFSMRACHLPPSVEHLPLFRKLIDEAEHAHRERRQQKLQIIRRQQQQHACVIQLLEQHIRQRSSLPSAYVAGGCGSTPSHERILHKKNNKEDRWSTPLCGAASGACEATAGGSAAAAAASRPTFSTLKHVIRAQAASRVARKDHRRQPAYGVVPAHRRCQNFLSSNSTSESSTSSRSSSRLQPRLPYRRAVKEQCGRKKGEDYEDSSRKSATKNLSSAEATTGCSSSYSSEQGGFFRSMSSTGSAACETSDTFFAGTGNDILVPPRDSRSAICLHKAVSDTWSLAVSSPSSSGRTHSRFRCASAEHLLSSSKASPRPRKSLADPAASYTPSTCRDSALANCAFDKRRQRCCTTSTVVAEERRANSIATFTVKSCPAGHTCDAAASPLGEQTFPPAGRSSEEEERIPVARESLAAYVKRVSSSSSDTRMALHGAWRQKHWPGHSKTQGETKNERHQLLYSDAQSGLSASSHRCHSSTPSQCRKVHYGSQANVSLSDSIFHRLHRLQHQAPLLPFEQFCQRPQHGHAAQKRLEKHSGAVFEYEEPRFCSRFGERNSDVEVNSRGHGYDVDSFYFAKSCFHSDFSKQFQECRVEGFPLLEKGGTKDTDCSPTRKGTRHLPWLFETARGRATAAPVQSFLGKLPTEKTKATPLAVRENTRKGIPNAFKSSQYSYSRSCSPLSCEVSAHVTATVTSQQKHTSVSKEVDEQRRPCNETLLQSFHEQLRERFPKHLLHHNAMTRGSNSGTWLCSSFTDSDVKSIFLGKKQKKLNERWLVKSPVNRDDVRSNWLAASQTMFLPSVKDKAPQCVDSPSVTCRYFPPKGGAPVTTETQCASAATAAAPRDPIVGSSITEHSVCTASFVGNAAISQSDAGVAHSSSATRAAVREGDAVKKGGLSAAVVVGEVRKPLMSKSVSRKSAEPLSYGPDPLEISSPLSHPPAAATAACVSADVFSYIAPLPSDAPGANAYQGATSSVNFRPAAAVAAAAASSPADKSWPTFATAAPPFDTPPPRSGGDIAHAGFCVASSSHAGERRSSVLYGGKKNCETSTDVGCSSTVSNSSSLGDHDDSSVYRVTPAQISKNIKSPSLSALSSALDAVKNTARGGENVPDVSGARRRLLSPSAKGKDCVNSKRSENYCSSSGEINNGSRSSVITKNMGSDELGSMTMTLSNTVWGDQPTREGSRDESVKRRSTTASSSASMKRYVLFVSHADRKPEEKGVAVEKFSMPLRISTSSAEAKSHFEHIRRPRDVYSPLEVSAKGGAPAESRAIGSKEDAVGRWRRSYVEGLGYCSLSSTDKEAADSQTTCSWFEPFRGGGTDVVGGASLPVSSTEKRVCGVVDEEDCCFDALRHIITKAREYRTGLALRAGHQEAGMSHKSNRAVHSESAFFLEPAVRDASQPQKTESSARTSQTGAVLGAAVGATTHAGMLTAAPVEKAAAIASDAEEATFPASHLCPPLATVSTDAKATTATPLAAAALVSPSTVGGLRADATCTHPQQVTASPAASSKLIAPAGFSKTLPPFDGVSMPASARAAAAPGGRITAVVGVPLAAVEPPVVHIETPLETLDLLVGLREGEKDMHTSEPFQSTQHKGVFKASTEARLFSKASRSTSCEHEDIPQNKFNKKKYTERNEEEEKGRPSNEETSGDLTVEAQKMLDKGDAESSRPAAVADDDTVNTNYSAAALCNASSTWKCRICQKFPPDHYSTGSAKHKCLDRLTAHDSATDPAMPAAAADASNLPSAFKDLSCGHHVDVVREQEALPIDTITVGRSSSTHTQDGLQVASVATTRKTFLKFTGGGSAAPLARGGQSVLAALSTPCHAVAPAASNVDAGSPEGLPPPSVTIVCATCRKKPLEHQTLQQQPAPPRDLHQEFRIDMQSSPNKHLPLLVQQYSRQQSPVSQHPLRQAQQELPKSSRQHALQQRQSERQLQSMLRQPQHHQPSSEPLVKQKQGRPQQLQEPRQSEAQQYEVNEIHCPFLMKAALSDNLTATQMSASMFLCSNCSSGSERFGDSGITTAAATPSSQPLVLSGPSKCLHAGLKDRTAAAAVSGSPAVPTEMSSHPSCGNDLAVAGDPVGSNVFTGGGGAPGAAASERESSTERKLVDSSPTAPCTKCTLRCEQQQKKTEATSNFAGDLGLSSVGAKGAAVVSTGATAQTAASPPAKATDTRDVTHVVSGSTAEEALLRTIRQQTEQTNYSRVFDKSGTHSPVGCNVSTDRLAVSTSLASLPSLGGLSSPEESCLTQLLTHLLLLFQQQRRCADTPAVQAAENKEVLERSFAVKCKPAAAGGELNGETAAGIAVSPPTESSVRGHFESRGQQYCAEAAARYMSTIGREPLPTNTGNCVKALRKDSTSSTSPAGRDDSGSGECDSTLHSDDDKLVKNPPKSCVLDLFLATGKSGRNPASASVVAPGDSSISLAAVRVRPSSPPPRPGGGTVTVGAGRATRTSSAPPRATEAAKAKCAAQPEALDAATTATPHTSARCTAAGKVLFLTSATAVSTTQTDRAARATSTAPVPVGAPNLTDIFSQPATTDVCLSASPPLISKKGRQQTGEIESQSELAGGPRVVPQVQALGVEAVCGAHFNIGSIMEALTAQRPHTWLSPSRRWTQASAANFEETTAPKPHLSREFSSSQKTAEAADAGERSAAASGVGKFVAPRGESTCAGNAAEAALPPEAGRPPDGGVSKSNNFSSSRCAQKVEEKSAMAARAGTCDDVCPQSETLRPLLLTSLLGMLSLSSSTLLPLISTSTPTVDLTNYRNANRNALCASMGVNPRRCSYSSCEVFKASRSKDGLCKHTDAIRSVELSDASDAVPTGGAEKWIKTLPPDLQQAAALSLAVLHRWSTNTALSYSASLLSSLLHHRQQPPLQAGGPEPFQIQQHHLPIQPQNHILATEEYSRQECQRRRQHPLQAGESRCYNSDGLPRGKQQPNSTVNTLEIPKAQERQHRPLTPSTAAAAALLPLDAKLLDAASLDSLHEGPVFSPASPSGATAAPLAPAAATDISAYAAVRNAPPCALQGAGRPLSLSQLQQVSLSDSPFLQRTEKQRSQLPQHQRQQLEKQDRLPLQHLTQVKEYELQPSPTPEMLLQQLLSEKCLCSKCASEENKSSLFVAAELGRPHSLEEKPCFLAYRPMQPPQKPQRDPHHQVDQQRQQVGGQLQGSDQVCVLRSSASSWESRQMQPHEGALKPEGQQCRHPQQECGQQRDGTTEGDLLLLQALQQQLQQHQTYLEGLFLRHAAEAKEPQKTSDQWSCCGNTCDADGGMGGMIDAVATKLRKRDSRTTGSSIGSRRMLVSSNKDHSNKPRSHSRRRKYSGSGKNVSKDRSKRRGCNHRSFSRGSRRRSSNRVVNQESDFNRLKSNNSVARWYTSAGSMESRERRAHRWAGGGAAHRQLVHLLSSADKTGSVELDVADSCATAAIAVADTSKYSGSAMKAQKRCVQLKDNGELKKKETKKKRLKLSQLQTLCTPANLGEVKSPDLFQERQTAAASVEAFSTISTEEETAAAVADDRSPELSCKYSHKDRRYLQRPYRKQPALPVEERRPQVRRSNPRAFPATHRGAFSCQHDEEQEGERRLKDNISARARLRSNCGVRRDAHCGSNTALAVKQNTAVHVVTEESPTVINGRSARVDNHTSRRQGGKWRRHCVSLRGRSKTQIQRSVSRTRGLPDSSEHYSSCTEESRIHGHGSSSVQVNRWDSIIDGSYHQRTNSSCRSFSRVLKSGKCAVSTNDRSGDADKQVLPMLRKHLQQQRELQEELDHVEQQLAGLHLLNSLTPITGSNAGMAATDALAESDARLETAVVSCSLQSQNHRPDSGSTDQADASAIASRSGKNDPWSSTSGSTAYWTPMSTSFALGGEHGHAAGSKRVRQDLSRDVKHPGATEHNASNSCSSPPHLVSAAQTCHLIIRRHSRTSSRSAASKRSDNCERIKGKEMLQLSGGIVAGAVTVKQRLREARLFPQDELCDEDNTKCKREVGEPTKDWWWSDAGATVSVFPLKMFPLQRPFSARQASAGDRRVCNPATKKPAENISRACMSDTQCDASPGEQPRRFKQGESPRRVREDNSVFSCISGGKSPAYPSTERFADDIMHQRELVAKLRASGVRTTHPRVVKNAEDTATTNAASNSEDSVRHQGNRRSRQQRPQQSRRFGRSLRTSLLFDSEMEPAVEGCGP